MPPPSWRGEDPRAVGKGGGNWPAKPQVVLPSSAPPTSHYGRAVGRGQEPVPPPNMERLRREDEEAAKRKAEVERARKAAEEQRRQREEEAKKKQAAAEAKKEEAKSVLVMRQVFKKLLGATMQTYDALHKEVTAALAEHKPKLGSQLALIEQEAEKFLGAAGARVEKLKESARKEEERKQQAKAQMEELENALKELDVLVEAAEAKADSFAEALKPLQKDTLTVEEFTSHMATVAARQEAADASFRACEELVAKHKLLDKTIKPSHGVAQRAEISRLVGRVNVAIGKTHALVEEFFECEHRVSRRIRAREQQEEIEKVFGKYDKKGTGAWGREAVVAFAKDQYGLDLSPDKVDHIVENVVPVGDVGISASQLALLRRYIGAARQEVRDRQRRVERLERERLEAIHRVEREKVLVGAREKMKERLAEVIDGPGGVVEVEQMMSKVDESLRGLNALPVSVSDEEIVKKAQEVEEECRSLVERVTNIADRTAPLGEEPQEPELLATWQDSVKKVTARVGFLKSKSSRALVQVRNAREAAIRRKALEAERCRQPVLTCVRKHLEEQDITVEALFTKICGSKEGSLSQEAFLQLVRGTCGCETGEEELGRFFAHLRTRTSGGGGGESLDFGAFSQLLKSFSKVVESTVMTSGLSIKESHTLKRLKVGDILEVLQTARLDGTTNIKRLRGITVKDGVEGWVSVAGNQGTTYLEDGGNQYKVSGDVDLQLESSPKATENGESPIVVRKLRKGEQVEVLAWESDSEGVAGSKVKARAKMDGAVGWVVVSKLAAV